MLRQGTDQSDLSGLEGRRAEPVVPHAQRRQGNGAVALEDRPMGAVNRPDRMLVMQLHPHRRRLVDDRVRINRGAELPLGLQ